MAQKLSQRVTRRCARALKARKVDQQAIPALLRLPAEIHSQIWALALPRDSVLTKTNPCIQVPALLRTNRQIRHEAFGMWFTSWTVKIDVVNCDSAFSMISTRCYSVLYYHAFASGLVSHKEAHLVVPAGLVFRGTPSWSNLFQFLAVLHENSYDCEQAAADPGRGNGEVIDSAMCITARMRKRPWSEVVEVLEMYHSAIAAKDVAWL